MLPTGMKSRFSASAIVRKLFQKPRPWTRLNAWISTSSLIQHNCKGLSLFSTINMAESRMTTILMKKEKLEEAISEMQKDMAVITKIVRLMKIIPTGRKGKDDVSKNQLSTEHVQSLLRAFLNLDNLILNLQNLLNRCTTHSFFLQKQLELQSYQLLPGWLYIHPFLQSLLICN